MEYRDTGSVKLRLATALRKAMHNNKLIEQTNKEKGIEDVSLISSMRQLEAASGLSFTMIQTIYTAKRDPHFTSVITILEALEISFPEFAVLYNGITNTEIEETKKAIEAGKKKVARKQGVRSNRKGGASS